MVFLQQNLNEKISDQESEMLRSREKDGQYQILKKTKTFSPQETTVNNNNVESNKKQTNKLRCGYGLIFCRLRSPQTSVCVKERKREREREIREKKRATIFG